MYKLGERIEKGNFSSSAKKKWMKVLVVDLAASIIVGVIFIGYWYNFSVNEFAFDFWS